MFTSFTCPLAYEARAAAGGGREGESKRGGRGGIGESPSFYSTASLPLIASQTFLLINEHSQARRLPHSRRRRFPLLRSPIIPLPIHSFLLLLFLGLSLFLFLAICLAVSPRSLSHSLSLSPIFALSLGLPFFSFARRLTVSLSIFISPPFLILGFLALFVLFFC